MRTLIVLLGIVCAPLFGQQILQPILLSSADDGPGTVCGSGYGWCKQVTIDHTKAGASDTPNITLVFIPDSTTRNSIRAASSGGHVQNATTQTGGSYTGSVPADFIVVSDSTCASKLAWEFQSYNSTTGAAKFWVKIATLSHTVDTTIWLCYGNAAVTTWQGDVSGAWHTNVAGVWHLEDGAALNAADSTSNASNGTNSSMAPATGRLDGGAYDAGLAYIDMGANIAALHPSTAVTVAAWYKPDGAQVPYAHIVDQDYSSTHASPFGGYDLSASAGGGTYYGFSVGANNAYNTVESGAHVVPDTWAYVVGRYDGLTIECYVNGGASVGSQSLTGAIDYSSTGPFRIGANATGGEGIVGTVDEVQVYNVALSADQILAMYNNQNSSSTMITFGAEQH